MHVVHDVYFDLQGQPAPRCFVTTNLLDALSPHTAHPAFSLLNTGGRSSFSSSSSSKLALAPPRLQVHKKLRFSTVANVLKKPGGNLPSSQNFEVEEWERFPLEHFYYYVRSLVSKTNEDCDAEKVTNRVMYFLIFFWFWGIPLVSLKLFFACCYRHRIIKFG